MLRVPARLDTRTVLLLAGDLLCFLLFAFIGLRSHEDGITFAGVARAAVPFQAGWLGVNLLLGGRFRGSEHASGRIARLWVPAWALGLVLRTLAFGRGLEVTFAVVALLFNGALLMLWRAVLAPLLMHVRR